MSDLVESPSKTEFKTPNAKSVNLTAEAISKGDEDDQRDTSLQIPHKSSPLVQLPPVQTDDNPQLIVQKKRKLQLVADPDEQVEASHVIPSKSRSNSISTRIPSLNDVSKPALTPPAPNLSYQSLEEKVSDDFISTISSDSGRHSLSVANKSTTAATINFSSPIRLEQSTPSDPKKELIALRRQESKLDSELVRARKKLETLKRAKVILAKSDSQDNEELVDKWRDAAQRASNYLLNAAIEKIGKTGGKKEFERREKEKIRNDLEYTMDTSYQERIFEITKSEEYEALPEEEKERILQDLEEEAEKSMRQLEKDMEAKERADDEKNNDNDDDFTMKDLYKRLKLDYKLVYPQDKKEEN